MDFVQSTEEFSPLPLHGDVSQSAEQTSTNQQGVESHFNATQDQSQTRRTKNHMELQLEFQDSNLSPALSLLPVNSGVAHFTECSVFQQSDANFAPLRPCTDISAASEKLHFPPKNRESQASEYGSLSQYPLIQESAFSEEGVSSCPSLFPHSVSPEEDERQLAMASSPLSSAVDDRQGMQSGGGTGSIETDKKTITASSHKQVGEVSEGGIVLVSRDSTAQHQKDLGVLSSSSAVSSASETALKRTKCLKGRVEGTMLGKPGADKITVTHEHPAGEASLPQQQTQNLSQMPSCEVSNINMGSRSTQPDDCSESLHRELLLESQKSNRSEAQPRSQPQEGPTTSEASLTPCPPSMSEVKLSRTRTNLREAVLTGLFSAGIEQDQREQEVWSLRNQTGIEGSYINFLPQSQSTPGVSKPPRKSIVKPTSRQVSIVNSNMEDLSQSSTGRHPQSAVPVAEFCHNNIPDQCQEEVASAKVQSLPSLTYMQKVGAWQTNQRSGHLSLFDSLVLQGFSGISPKKKAYDAVSGPLNDILNQQARSLHQHPASDVNKNITKKSISESMLFSPRNETVGSVTKDKGDDESAARIFASSVGRDTSHSSLSTVVKSTQKAQQTQKSGERQSLVQDDVHQQMVATVKPLPFLSLGHISDVTLSSSQDSSRSGKKLGASIGSSSVISMEVHNYIPNWNTKVTTPPALTRPRELSIEERIPLYLYNRGVEQSMSTILTPFVPRGPIREPEFSLTDLSTVKGSVGTPAKSTQPSEVGSSHIEAFSRSSILSVETSISVSLSQDSIYPTVSIPEQISVSRSSAAPNQNDQRLTPCTQPDDASPPVLQSDSSFINTQDTTQVGNNTEGNLVKLPSAPERDPDQSMHVSMQQKAKHSLVGTKELEDSHLTLSQKETCVPAGIPVSSPAASRLSSDNILLSWKKTDIQKDSSFISSSTDVGPTSPASMVRTSPSSDSILTSEKVTQPYTVHKRKQSSVQSNAIIPGVTVTYMKPQDSMISGSVWPMLTLSKSTWRTEPEGCSAVPPDNTIPTQLPLKPSAAIITQAASSPAEAGVPEEIEQITQTVPAESSSSSPTLADTEQGTNDGSSELSQTARVAARESPLSTRVAKLLQNDSPATTVSSMYIITDTEENTSKDWIKLKISRQQGDSLELDIEDRKRIEEIKRELLLKNTVKSQESTITDSGMSSTFRGLRKQESLLPIGTFNTVSGVNIQPSLQPLQFSMNLSDSRVQQYHPHYQDLASQVLEIAAREGIILARTDPRTFTSIGISTSKCSHSPTKSTIPLVKPDPKLLGTILDKEKSVGTAPITVSELVNGYLNTIGDKYEGGHTLSSALDKEHMNVQEENIQSQQENHKLMIQDISVSGVGYGVQQATGVSTTETPASIGHISRVHLTLSPKATDQSVAADVQSSHATANPSLALSEFDKLRHWPSKASSPDKGVRLSIRPKLSESRDPEQTTGTERTETSVPFKTIVPKGGIISSSPQSFKLLRRTAVSPRPFISETPAIPILLPYKPTGSDELFYVPQTEADISSTDVTEESSHTGSDEAVPPRFSSDILGHEDSKLDRGVTIRHTEGIYSKRAKTGGVKMQTTGHRGVFVAADCSLHPCINRAPKPPSRVSSALTTVPSSCYQEVSKRDQGTSPVQSLNYDQPQARGQVFYPAHLEPGPVSQVRAEQDKEKRVSDLNQPAAKQRSSTLDQLWQRCYDQWYLDESLPTNDRQSLLERAECLSLLIQRTRANTLSEEQHKEYQNPYTMEQRSRKKGKDPAVVRDRRGSVGEVKRGVCAEFTAVREEVPERREECSSLVSTLRQQLCPPEREESDNLSTASGSMSTVDTARLIQAFGAHRVQRLNPSSSLSKLYNTIHKQRDETGGSKKLHKAPPAMTVPSDVADESSFAADNSSSSSAYAYPPHHGPSRALVAKKAIKLVNKCIQAGDTEIVNNGTWRHTRDVGTTFPSPGESRPPWLLSSSSSSVVRESGGQKSSWKTQRKNAKPEAVSWFIPADDLRVEERKENHPEEESSWRPYTWFEPYSRTDPWREPLRQRQAHNLDPRRKPAASGLTCISLQEALEMRRPDFISQSRQRMKCLALQMEERKLQAVLNKQRHEHFHHLCPPGRLQRFAGAARIRRAVPRKEMIQRSKLMYENLPEVQRRREEEKRKMEYCLNRLNAELYKKRVTERVLGRRKAWH